jgi:hypothetical protein
MRLLSRNTVRYHFTQRTVTYLIYVLPGYNSVNTAQHATKDGLCFLSGPCRGYITRAVSLSSERIGTKSTKWLNTRWLHTDLKWYFVLRSVARIRQVKTDNPSTCVTVNWKVCKPAKAMYLSVIKRTCGQGANISNHPKHNPLFSSRVPSYR